MTHPFVSVLIDTYNHERFIEQAIQSALEQDFPAANREILVVDDGSTDRTPEIVKKFEPQVRLLQKANGGQASAFNFAIPQMRGEILTFLDGDDWWAPGKLRCVAEVLSPNPAVGLVGHGIVNAFDDGTESTDAPKKVERLRLTSLAAAQVFRLRKSYLGTSRMALRAGVARQILPVPEALVIEADEYLFTLAAALSEIVILPDTLTHYRQHGANLYNAAGGNAAGLRGKQRVMAALGEALRQELPARGVPADAVGCVCEIVQAEADQLRLILDGGYPWETVSTEWTIYRVMHESPPWRHLLFRFMTMIPAAVLPPSWFYFARRRLAASDAYGRLRRVLFPVPEPTHVQRFRGTGA